MKEQNEKIKNQFLIEFGKNVREIRKNKKLTQIELAMRINGDNNKIGRIERGAYNFKISSLLIIAQALEVEVVELFNIKDLNLLKNRILQNTNND